MSAAGTPLLSSEEFLSYLLAGLSSEYDAFFTSVTARVEPLSPEEFYSLLLTHESLLAHSNYLPASTDLSTIITTTSFTCGHGPYRGSHYGNYRGRGRGRSIFSSPPTYSPNRSTNLSSSLPHSKPTCQVCGKVGHVALKCYYRFDHSYQSDPPKSLSAHYSTSTSSPSMVWYPNIAATNHLNSNISNLDLNSTPYGGNDHIRIGDGSTLPISNIGDSALSTSSRTFLLKNLLHVPDSTKNLISVRQFCFDSSVFFEFHSSFFDVKDSTRGITLLHWRMRDGLYSFPSAVSSSPPQALVGERTSSSQWHAHLGRPSLQLVHHIITTHSLHVSHCDTPQICSSCCQAKSPQLPFRSSHQRSTKPLQLVYFDVWGPASILSREGFKYYVSF